MPLDNDPELSAIAEPPYLNLMVKHLKPMQLKTIDEDNIFVFFHLRKGGGSTIRNAIHTSLNESMDTTGQHQHISQWIPCFDPSPCVPYSIPPTNKAVYTHRILVLQICWPQPENQTHKEKISTNFCCLMEKITPIILFKMEMGLEDA